VLTGGREEQDRRSFFVLSCYTVKASNVRHVEPNREETLHPLCRGHMNTRSARREPFGIAFLPSPNT
jgi:hypothetical protein